MSAFWISTDLGFYRLVLPREVKVPFYPFLATLLVICHDKNALWGRCFTTSTSLTPHLFLLGWLKLNLNLLLDQ